jgi:hypothetical protein
MFHAICIVMPNVLAYRPAAPTPTEGEATYRRVRLSAGLGACTQSKQLNGSQRNSKVNCVDVSLVRPRDWKAFSNSRCNEESERMDAQEIKRMGQQRNDICIGY